MTTIKPDEISRAIFIRSHLRLMSVGMKHSKMSRKQVLALASEITDKKYPNSSTGCDNARDDLKKVIDNG